MTVKKILIEWLKSHGYDGLYCSDYDCSCDIESINCCDLHFAFCEPGVKVKLENDLNYDYKIIPRKESMPEEICTELKCSGIDEKTT